MVEPREVSGHCAEEAHRLYEFALSLYEHQLDIMRSAASPRKAKSEVLFQLNSNIDNLNELEEELGPIWPKETRDAVIKELSTIKSQIESMPASDDQRIIAEAAEGYQQLVHGVLLPEILQRFAACECDTRREHEPEDTYNFMPSFDDVRMRLVILREFKQPRRQGQR